jgi:NADH-ubiquinone oxidoreductase chain 2
LIPPFIGFYSKLYVLFSAIASLEYFIAIIAIIVSVISAYYYLRIITVIYSDNKNKTQLNLNTSIILLSNLHSYIISVLTLFLILFFLNPNLILTSTRVLSLSIFNS